MSIFEAFVYVLNSQEFAAVLIVVGLNIIVLSVARIVMDLRARRKSLDEYTTREAENLSKQRRGKT
jgi:hypothetical protein